MRAAEDREGREVLLGVAALRGGVDENGAARGPHDVAAPQVAVGAGGADVALAAFRFFDEARLAVVECARFEALAEFLDERAFGGREGAVVEVGGDALSRVEAPPRLGPRRPGRASGRAPPCCRRRPLPRAAPRAREWRPRRFPCPAACGTRSR